MKRQYHFIGVLTAEFSSISTPPTPLTPPATADVAQVEDKSSIE